MRVSQTWKSLFIAAPMLAADVHAESINWYCTANKVNLTSSGQAMDAAFQFQLGVFTGGFTPHAGNISQWAANWHSADSNSYSEASKSFSSAHHFAGNTGAFTVGAKGYVWGRRSGATHDEWILFRKSDWNWPAAATPPGSRNWSTASASANDVILGSLNSGGTPFLMQSAAVHSYNQWRNVHLAGEMLIAANDDPDHDGSPNLLEFVFGTSPTQAGAPTPTPVSFVEISGQQYLQISIPRLRNRLANVVVEVSTDLVIWNSGTSYTVEISNTSEAIVVRDLLPSGPGLPERFLRARVVISP
ncbi:MAG: hypothetical protein V4689_07885 [Verrucomicrobiota bacterium]